MLPEGYPVPDPEVETSVEELPEGYPDPDNNVEASVEELPESYPDPEHAGEASAEVIPDPSPKNYKARDNFHRFRASLSRSSNYDVEAGVEFPPEVEPSHAGSYCLPVSLGAILAILVLTGLYAINDMFLSEGMCFGGDVAAEGCPYEAAKNVLLQKAAMIQDQCVRTGMHDVIQSNMTQMAREIRSKTEGKTVTGLTVTIFLDGCSPQQIQSSPEYLASKLRAVSGIERLKQIRYSFGGSC